MHTFFLSELLCMFTFSYRISRQTDKFDNPGYANLKTCCSSYGSDVEREVPTLPYLGHSLKAKAVPPVPREVRVVGESIEARVRICPCFVKYCTAYSHNTTSIRYSVLISHVSLDKTSQRMAQEPPLDEIQWRSPKAQEMGGIHTNTGKSTYSRRFPSLLSPTECLSQCFPTSPNPLSSTLPLTTPP